MGPEQLGRRGLNEQCRLSLKAGEQHAVVLSPMYKVTKSQVGEADGSHEAKPSPTTRKVSKGFHIIQNDP